MWLFDGGCPRGPNVFFSFGRRGRLQSLTMLDRWVTEPMAKIHSRVTSHTSDSSCADSLVKSSNRSSNFKAKAPRAGT
jgi:hypothetical protein